MKKLKYIFALFTLVVSLQSFAQVGINMDGAEVDNSAALEIKSDSSGLLMPRMTTNKRNDIQNPADGLMVYDSSLKTIQVFNGTQWKQIQSEDFWNANGNDVYLNFSGNLGIGTNTPAFPLTIDKTYTGLSGWYPAFRTKYILNPTSQISQPGYGIASELYIDGEHNFTDTDVGQSAGFFVSYNNLTSGATASKVGGVHGRVYNISSETLPLAYGFSAFIESSGSITNAAAYYVNSFFNAGSGMENTYGVYINNLAVGNNRYGVYIDDQTGAGANSYGIYSSGSHDNFFEGNVGIGVTNPEEKIEVAGNINLTSKNYKVLMNGNQFISGKGTQSVYVGELAGNVVTGSFNAFFGYGAGKSQTGGGVNTFIGHAAGESATSGESNTFVGAGAGKSMINGEYNVFLGSNCGGNNNGNRNVFIGDYAGRNNSGSNNVIIGQAAGYSGSGSRNVLIGFEAGQSNTASDRLFIDNSSTSTPLIYGEFSNDLVRINNKLGVNISPQRSLHVNDVMRLQPRATAPSNPAEGDMYMDSSTHKLMVYDGTSWQACW